jgi:hypothetical protein
MNLRSRTLAIASLALGSAAAAQGLEQNPLRLHNGADVVFLSPPSAGGAFTWKVFPREALRHPSGFLHLTGIEFLLFDGNPATPSGSFQFLLTSTIPSPTYPGAFEPDLSSPLATLISIGGVLIPGATCLNPQAEISLALSTSIQIPADGSSDLALVIFHPACGAVVGPCGLPDCTYLSFYSNDEKPADELGGVSPYGGTQLPGVGTILDTYVETLAIGLHFEEPLLAIRTGPVGGPAPADLGLAGLNLPLSQSARQFAYTVRAVAPAGSIALAASALSSPLPGAGLPLFGTGLLLDPADPAFAPTLRAGGFNAPSSAPATSLEYKSSAPIALNSAAIGVSFHSQAFVLQPIPGIARSSNLVRTDLLP